jgi:heme/copper-type cytochrome/quinol oxidase subunit 3
MSATATATAEHGGHAAHVLPPDEHFGQATTGKIGMWVFLLSDAFSFGGLLLGYGILRGGTSGAWRGPDEPLFGIPFTAALTFLLICSRFNMVRAVESAKV